MVVEDVAAEEAGGAMDVGAMVVAEEEAEMEDAEEEMVDVGAEEGAEKVEEILVAEGVDAMLGEVVLEEEEVVVVEVVAASTCKMKRLSHRCRTIIKRKIDRLFSHWMHVLSFFTHLFYTHTKRPTDTVSIRYIITRKVPTHQNT